MTAFRSFVIFAGMRTGSNLLEATLNGVRRVTCFGEAFNPYMMGWPDKDELRGITMAEREADLLPVGYFHVVFTLPAEVADVALQNKAAVYHTLDDEPRLFFMHFWTHGAAGSLAPGLRTALDKTNFSRPGGS